MQTTFPIYRRQSLGFLVSLCAVAALANCAKADIVAAQELANGRVIVNDPTAYIGSEQNHVDTPWMIVFPDAMQGFANDFTTNAISVVSEDGTNFYAHIETERIDNFGRHQNDRTKVIHFTVDENGIPSKKGKLIDTSEANETPNQPETHFQRMRNRKLVGIKNGYLYFAPTDNISAALPSFFIYNPTNRVVSCQGYSDFRASYQNDSNFYVIRHQSDTNQNDIFGLYKYTDKSVAQTARLTGSEDTNMAVTFVGNTFYVGAGENVGNIRKGTVRKKALESETPLVTLPGPISGLSNNGDEVFATTTATNAFYNVTLGQYNVVKDENGNPTPMVPPTTNGLVRVIDNRQKGGKFLFVTATGIYSVD